MNILKKFIHIIFTAFALVLITTSSHAVEPEVCAPFKKIVDDTLINNMLEAAEFDQFFRIKKDSSKMSFCVQSAVGLVKGDFDNFQGGFALNGSNSQTMVSIDVSSLNTNIMFIEGILKGVDFLDSERHPKLIFISSGFHWISANKAVLKGRLTMRGVTKDVAFYIDISNVDDDELGSSNSILVKASTTVLRSEFGMNSMSPLISDKINLCMSVEAERYKTI